MGLTPGRGQNQDPLLPAGAFSVPRPEPGPIPGGSGSLREMKENQSPVGLGRRLRSPCGSLLFLAAPASQLEGPWGGGAAFLGAITKNGERGGAEAPPGTEVAQQQLARLLS